MSPQCNLFCLVLALELPLAFTSKHTSVPRCFSTSQPHDNNLLLQEFHCPREQWLPRSTTVGSFRVEYKAAVWEFSSQWTSRQRKDSKQLTAKGLGCYQHNEGKEDAQRKKTCGQPLVLPHSLIKVHGKLQGNIDRTAYDLPLKIKVCATRQTRNWNQQT